MGVCGSKRDILSENNNLPKSSLTFNSINNIKCTAPTHKPEFTSSLIQIKDYDGWICRECVQLKVPEWWVCQSHYHRYPYSPVKDIDLYRDGIMRCPRCAYLEYPEKWICESQKHWKVDRAKIDSNKIMMCQDLKTRCVHCYYFSNI